jgi:hypothetical protein
MPWNRFLVILFGVAAVLAAAGIAVALLSGDDTPQDAPVDPASAVAAPNPLNQNPATPSQLAVEDPPPASSSSALADHPADPGVKSAFAAEAEKLRDELREHDVPFTESDVAAIIVIGEEAVARSVPDLSAADPAITERVAQSFPHYTRQQRKDVVRCVAEQAEKVIARNTGDGVPPDERGPGG